MQKVKNLVSIIEELSRQIITCEHILDEDVFINNVNNRKNIAHLTYDNRGFKRNKGNLAPLDMIKTSKMNNTNGSDTYEVKLKNGLTSYNITDINGTEVMHYFKKKFKHEKTQIKMGDVNYDLEMEDREFSQFMNDFLTKVNNVIKFYSEKLQKENKEFDFDTISLYPVPSSSNFNKEMVKRIVGKHPLMGLPCQIIDSSLLKKNTSDLTIDNDFVEKNRDYYNSQRYKGGSAGLSVETHMNALEKSVSKLLSLSNIQKAIDIANEYTKIENRKYTGKLIIKWNNVKAALKNGKLTDNAVLQLDDMYRNYQWAVANIVKASEWFDTIARKTKKQQIAKIARAIKYSKGPSIEKRRNEIETFLKERGLGKRLPKETYDVCMWEPIPFEIKKMGNDVRMALTNYFKPNENTEIVKQEVNKAEKSIVVVFDDNISGGATLSDICTQIQKLGLKYIIPITFGQMRESYNVGTLVINKPEKGFNFS